MHYHSKREECDHKEEILVRNKIKTQQGKLQILSLHVRFVGCSTFLSLKLVPLPICSFLADIPGSRISNILGSPTLPGFTFTASLNKLLRVSVQEDLPHTAWPQQLSLIMEENSTAPLFQTGYSCVLYDSKARTMWLKRPICPFGMGLGLLLELYLSRLSFVEDF